MKSYLHFGVAILATATLFTACNDDDNGSPIVHGTTGETELYFDNGIAGNEFSLSTAYANSNGENITVNRFNYIIGNIVLIDSDGNEYAYPKDESYYIINQEAGEFSVHLHEVPAGDYSKIRFGIGVDQERYAEGQAAQENFWNAAIAGNMGLTWAEGYRFLNMEGTYTSNGNIGVPFQVHLRNSNGANHYREVTLTLPTTARVRHDESPSIHIMTDVNVVLDGVNKVVLQDHNTGGSAQIDSGAVLNSIASNVQQMFTVDHVHNGSGHHD